ncbi:hypothetical protein CONPUDRAFT_75471 [Coniophora puteana RWD-64-598 SS2]|uniref:Uncharacterized protein n=1 Tax=Coniophora puteana (strain RWD-64-598) TaxID=741705 RepID=A0A5M3MEE4_CONPW|nr:uncharacterized protein CONPUDRAFT_75471 [Coniophora puteana RWD-64-598 SS2]EIW77639.1 hypothetical protein CONPUDRAFT_75471 [Coniophora puteana RWD-64-598 SS2]
MCSLRHQWTGPKTQYAPTVNFAKLTLMEEFQLRCPAAIASVFPASEILRRIMLRTTTGLLIYLSLLEWNPIRFRGGRTPGGVTCGRKRMPQDWLFRVQVPLSPSRNEPTRLELSGPRIWNDEKKDWIRKQATFTRTFDQREPPASATAPLENTEATDAKHAAASLRSTSAPVEENAPVLAPPTSQRSQSVAPPSDIPVNDQTPNDIEISERTRYPYRGFPEKNYWVYESRSNQLLVTPPRPPDVHEGDFFCHRARNMYQVWIWTTRNRTLQWAGLDYGSSPPQEPDRFVAITEKGTLTLVQKGTWDRVYRHKLSPIVQPRQV